MFVCTECGASQPSPGYCPNDGTQLVSNQEDQLLGQQIGPYRVARLLGVGGMGRVYKAVHPQIGSRVAIKMLSREVSDRRDIVERFFSEARAVNLIRHESIVNVLDLATLPDGRPYIVMEYLDGAPLSAIIEQAQRSGQPLPLGGIARLAAEVLDALGAAHAKGIVHRDLKPDNIFVTPAGRAKVLDFGIAKLQPELGGRATHTGSLLGTPHYMSPEQAASRHVDTRADLYAIGVILFECATLHKPFVAQSLFDLLRMHIEAPPPSPRAARPDLPVELEHVILTALAKAPEQRFGNAQAMSAALQHATAQLPSAQWATLAPPQGARPQSWQPTPPASWARNSPTAPGAPSIATAPSPTPPPPRSRTGLWIGLAGVMLAAGGVATAVIATRSDSSSGSGSGSESASGSGSGSASASGSGSASGSASGSDSWAGPGSAAGSATRAGSPTDPDDIPSPPIDLGALGGLDDETSDALISGFLDSTDAKQRAAMPKELRAALAKYGKWEKVPKKERAKLAGASLAWIQRLTLGAGDQINDALSGGDPAPAPPAPQPLPKPAGGWFQRHNVSPPGFDPKHAKIDQLISFAYAEAHKYVPDAELTRIDMYSVYPDGHADLTLPTNSGHGEVLFRFVSPSRAKPDSHLPHGVPQQFKECAFYIVIEPGDSSMYDVSSDGQCREKPLPHPRCSVAAIWKKALAQKSLPDSVAEIDYREFDGKPAWFFDIKDGTRYLFEGRFSDDCR